MTKSESSGAKALEMPSGVYLHAGPYQTCVWEKREVLKRFLDDETIWASG